MSAITINVEPLSWEVLAYWITKHPDDGPAAILPAPIVVARRPSGEVVGFGALNTEHTMQLKVPVVAPLYADNIRIGIRIGERLEQEIAKIGEPYYLFWVNADRNYDFIGAIDKVGACTRLWTTEANDVWYRRDIQPPEPDPELMEGTHGR